METNQLTVIDEQLKKTRAYIVALVGTKLDPKPIADDKALVSVQENIAILKALRKDVKEYFYPIKIEAKKPYEQVLEKENAWHEAIEEVFVLADNKIREYNAKLRAEIQAREQKEADERAQAVRDKLAREKEEALKAGNTEAAAALQTQSENTVAGTVAERKIQSKSDINTMSEQAEIADFQVVNELDFIMACIDSGLGYLLVTDKKTHTAFKKVLTTTKKDTDKWPGCTFRRDYKPIFRNK